MKQKAGTKGFTLLELLAAMGMMVVLAGSLYGSLYIGLKSKERAEAAVGPVRQSRIILKILQQDIEASLPPTGILEGVFQGFSGVDSRGRDSDTLLFYTSRYSPHIPGVVSDIVQVELLLTPSYNNQTNYLVRRTTVNLLPSATPEYHEEILCRDVASLNLNYYDGYDWLDNWDSAAMEDTLPQAVEITIDISQPAPKNQPEYENYYTATRVFLVHCSQIDSGQETMQQGNNPSK
ncbi:MAG: GspJ family type II secretion system protein [Sedimentisphaerales bacterium]|nr:GspJ family type II secretion system protein [Sedimentisphaerales bacterium]